MGFRPGFEFSKPPDMVLVDENLWNRFDRFPNGFFKICLCDPFRVDVDVAKVEVIAFVTQLLSQCFRSNTVWTPRAAKNISLKEGAWVALLLVF